MDFFSYLKNSGKQLDKKSKNDNHYNNNDNNDNNNNDKNIDKIEIELTQQNFNFKKGETVIITRYENSIYNYYKGYYAIIKKYKQNADYAYVILPAMNYPSLIKMPIKHFSKI